MRAKLGFHDQSGQRQGAQLVARQRVRRKMPAGKRNGSARSAGICARVPILLVVLGFGNVEAQSLQGGLASMEEQYRRALEYDYTFIEDPAEVRNFVNLKLLVPVNGNGDYQLDDEVSFPYARPEVLTFIERLSRQYRAACGEVLVVTSLTRPKSYRPRNSSKLSVHPTGMAVDLRRSNTPACRTWIQRVLLHLERSGTIQATHERRPPHYHVAVYTKDYARYVAQLEADDPTVAGTGPDARAEAAGATGQSAGSGSASFISYRVRSGDSLWSIARAHGITVARLKLANDLTSSRIYAGQRLDVPVSSR